MSTRVCAHLVCFPILDFLQAKSKSTNGQAKKTQQNAIGSMFNKASKKEPAPKPQEKAAPKSVDKQSDAPPKVCTPNFALDLMGILENHYNSGFCSDSG